jgi:hypothetical protein
MRTKRKQFEIRYDNAIKDLQYNDHNATWYEILDECDGNYFVATKRLKQELLATIEQYKGVCRMSGNHFKRVLKSLEP